MTGVGQGRTPFFSFGYATGNYSMTGFSQNLLQGTFSGSPEDIELMCKGPFTNNGSPSTLGKSKSILNSWETTYTFTNIDNDPLKIECFGIKCINDLGYDDVSNSLANDIIDFVKWINDQMKESYNNFVGPATAIESDQPGFKLSDLPIFLRHFRIKSHKTRLLQPGEVTTFRKFKNRPKVWKESDIWSITQNNPKLLAAKGSMHYIFRLSSIPVNSAGAGPSGVTFGRIYANCIQTRHYRHGFLYGDSYNGYLTNPLPTTIATEKSIFPGTSTANNNAPAV